MTLIIFNLAINYGKQPFVYSYILEGDDSTTEQNQLNDNYLTLDFDCGFKENLKKIYDIFLLRVKRDGVTWGTRSHSQTFTLFICDIRLYHFESGCGKPDIPLQMDIKREDTVAEY